MKNRIYVIPEKKQLGEILIERQMLTSAQLKQALRMQDREGGYLGEILTSLNLVDVRDLVVALSLQSNVPFIDLNKVVIDSDIIRMIPAHLAWRYLVLPLDRVGSILSLVMANPVDIAARMEIHRVTKYELAAFVAGREDIETFLEKHYGPISDPANSSSVQ